MLFTTKISSKSTLPLNNWFLYHSETFQESLLLTLIMLKFCNSGIIMMFKWQVASKSWSDLLHMVFHDVSDHSPWMKAWTSPGKIKEPAPCAPWSKEKTEKEQGIHDHLPLNLKRNELSTDTTSGCPWFTVSSHSFFNRSLLHGSLVLTQNPKISLSFTRRG